MDVSKKIVFIHPSIRVYRKGLFKLLSKNLNIEFFWTQGLNQNKHINQEVSDILKNTNIKYIQGNEIKFFPFDNFSLGLFTLLFRGYKIFIFSNILSVPFLLLAPLVKLMGKKIIVFDELWRYPKEVKKYKIVYPYIKFLSKYCLDGIVAAGSKSKEFFENEFDFNKDRIEIAYNTTVDTSELIGDDNLNKLISKRLNLATKKKKILYLGRIVKYKGLDLLINSMLGVNKEYDLIVIGDGPFKKECIFLTEKLKLKNRIHFLGSCLSNESPYFYNNCDIFVLPSRLLLHENVQNESWGFTLNEAIALEKAVVATNAVGSAYDLIINENHGRIALESNVENLTLMVNELITSNTDNKIGKNARRRLMSLCSYEQNFLAYKKLIDKVVSE